MATTTDTHVFRAFAPALRDTGLPAGVIGQVSGIAVVYDVVDSWGTTFARGSLDRTMRERIAAGKVKLFWDHGDALVRDGMYDSDLHIGTVKSLQDVELPDGGWGAYMVADIIDTPKGQEVKKYLQGILSSGGQTGLSVGGIASGVKSSMIRKDGVKIEQITEFPIREISITSMQAVPDSEVMAVWQHRSTTRVVIDPKGVIDEDLRAKIEAAIVDGTLVARTMVDEVTTETEEGSAIIAETLAVATESLQVKDRPSLEAALDALLYALPLDVIRAHVGAVLGNATTTDSDAAGPTPADSDAEAEDSRTTDAPPVVFATMDERLRALRQSYAEAA